jgi:HD-GYP domain-containing protein (c-di-GMP phosphodiesterase class II)
MQVRQPQVDDHAGAVADRALRVARRLGVSDEALEEIRHAAELRDVGKVGVPDAILAKPAPLDGHEWAFIQEHTILGERILEAAPALSPVAALVRASHERWDGTGYPDRLAGTEIPLGARIVAVCNAFEAMTTDRPYRRALAERDARAELRANAGSQFDPEVVDVFLRTLDDMRGDGQAPDAVAAAAGRIRGLLSGGEWTADLRLPGPKMGRAEREIESAEHRPAG